MASCLIEVLDKNLDVGAVGSKLIYPDNTLQEAGGIIWNDASGCNFGREVITIFLSIIFKKWIIVRASLAVQSLCLWNLVNLMKNILPLILKILTYILRFVKEESSLQLSLLLSTWRVLVVANQKILE